MNGKMTRGVLKMPVRALGGILWTRVGGRIFSTEQIRCRSGFLWTENRKRRLTMKRSSTLGIVVVAVMLLGLGSSAFAASDDISRLKDTLRLHNVTIPWLFPLSGGTCTIPAAVGSINPVDNRSDRERKVSRDVMADGSQVIVQDEVKSGTAVDSNGDTYSFVYEARVVANVSPGLPASVNVRMTDSFRVKGHGLHLHVAFDWRWDYEAPSGVDVTLEPLSDSSIVPFVFATADGVTPAPGVTNWQQTSTRGDPWNCDPL